jgi:pimeloyl-ACP methyl ester carboxylesterase
MPVIEIFSGLTIFYLDENPCGSACVLLLHGLGANSSSWGLQIPALVVSGFRIIVPDTPGFGQSPYHIKVASANDWARTLAAFLRALEIEKTNVIGISMGGVQALQLALDYPNLVNKLVLINTYARLNTTNLRVLPYYLVRAILVLILSPSAQAQTVANRLFPEPSQEKLREELIAQICQADPGGYRASMRVLARYNVLDRLQEIKSPTLVITGELDTTVPPEIQNVLVKGIPKAKQVQLHAGHALSVEIPDQFNEILVKHLIDDPGNNLGY